MLFLILYLALLLFSLAYFVKKKFLEEVAGIDNAAKTKKAEYSRLGEEFRRLKQDNEAVEKEIKQNTALYEITKGMCASLDQRKIFSIFKDNLGKYIKISDCQMLEKEKVTDAGQEYSRFPLGFEGEDLGCVAVRGLNKEEEGIFSVLMQQLLLAVRRAALYKKVQELAITDSLTNALSRRYCLERFREELDRSTRLGLNFCVLMVDIDHFKHYNDRYGHLVGDAVLKEIVGAIAQNLRHIDFIGRYGGEEFLVILPETKKESGMVAAQRLRSKIESHTVYAYDEKVRVTISIGLATFPEDSLDYQELIDKADWALYRCKNTGRNKVCAYRVYK